MARTEPIGDDKRKNLIARRLLDGSN